MGILTVAVANYQAEILGAFKVKNPKRKKKSKKKQKVVPFQPLKISPKQVFEPPKLLQKSKTRRGGSQLNFNFDFSSLLVPKKKLKVGKGKQILQDGSGGGV